MADRHRGLHRRGGGDGRAGLGLVHRRRGLRARCGDFGRGLAVQLAVFLAVSAVLLAFVCPIARKKWTKKPERMNADRLAGQTAIVTETIDACADTGAVRVSGVLWTAKCATGERIEKGRHVTIERVEGAKLYVKPAEMPCEKA